MYDECDRTGVERPHYFNTEKFVRTVFKRPDMSKWTHDGFINDTVATENDTVAVENGTVAVGNDKVDSCNAVPKDISNDISEDISQMEISPKLKRLINTIAESWYSLYELLDILNFSSRPAFTRNYLKPALEFGYITLEKPNAPNAPNQRYGLTDKGRKIYYASKSIVGNK